VHMRPEDEARHKVEETLDDESRVSCHLFFTLSDIAYVLSIIKNGQEMWDAKNPSTSPEKS